MRDVARVMFILVSMGQIFVTLPGTIKVGWPSNVRGFLQWFQGFVEFDVISITGTTCDKRVDFRAQFLFMAIIPLLIVFWAIIGYCLKGRERNARLQVEKELAKASPEQIRDMLRTCYTELFASIDQDQSGYLCPLEVLDESFVKWRSWRGVVMGCAFYRLCRGRCSNVCKTSRCQLGACVARRHFQR